MHDMNGFKQQGCLLILTEGCEDEDKVLNCKRVLLVHRLNIGHEVLTLAVFSKFHEAIGLDCVEKRLLRVFLQTYLHKRTKERVNYMLGL